MICPALYWHCKGLLQLYNTLAAKRTEIKLDVDIPIKLRTDCAEALEDLKLHMADTLSRLYDLAENYEPATI